MPARRQTRMTTGRLATTPRTTTFRSKYDGFYFNKANARCGRYQFWSTEKTYYDNDPNVAINGRIGYYPTGSTKEKAVQELSNRLVATRRRIPRSSRWPTCTSRGRVTALLPFPNKPYNAFCDQP